MKYLNLFKPEFSKNYKLRGYGFAFTLIILSSQINWAGEKSVMKRINPGIQLYTVRHLLEKDFEGTLRKVAELGYKEIEFAGFFGVSPDSLSRLLLNLRLKPIAAHLPLQTLETGLDTALQTIVKMKIPYVVLGWLPPEKRSSVEDYKKLTLWLNKVGQQCNQSGVQFVYHNHDFELKSIDGLIPYDLLLKDTHADWVKMEMDVYWILKGGGDPKKYLEEHPNRFILSHLKDMKPGKSQEMTDPGKGIVDFKAFVSQAKKAGMEHFFIEHDSPERPLETLSAGVELFKRLQ